MFTYRFLGIALAAMVSGAILAGRPAAAHAAEDVVTTAQADGRFSTLVTALTAAGLADTLKGPGPFTVFAPTDEAFGKLPPGTVDALLRDPDRLKAVLLYHVVPGNVEAADVVKLTSATTVQGSSVRIAVSGGTVMVNNARVVVADVKASNGVIHVIDSVLLPPTGGGAPAAMPNAGDGLPSWPVAAAALTGATVLAAGWAARRRAA